MAESLEIIGTTDAGLEIVPCALCGGTRTRPYCVKFGYPIVKCAGCGLVYCSPRMTSEETDKRYSPEYFWKEYLPSVKPPPGMDEGAFLDLRFSAPLALLANGRPPARLLEIGTGAGFFLKAATRAGFDAHGLELSPEACDYARNTLGLRVIQASAEEMPFDPAYFDAAAMFEVIEHLRDPLRVVRAAHRALKPGGRFVVSTPNLGALSRHVLGDEWAVLSPGEHLYYFTETTLRAMLMKASFRSVRFVRQYGPWLHHETMNARYTHAPGGPRARAYYRFVDTAGQAIYRGVQRLGLADGLLAVAEA
jgi:SAM-dependent methyltransferase